MTSPGGPQLCPVSHFRDPERPRKSAEGARLCRGCMRRADVQLDELHTVSDDLLGGRRGESSGFVTGTLDPAAPASPEQMAARVMIRETLVGWCKLVAAERRVASPADTTYAMCAFLRRHLLWLAADEQAKDFAEGIDWTVYEARRVAYPSRPDKVYIGDCPEEIEHTDGEQGPCAGRLYAAPDSPYVECGKCGTRDTLDEWLRKLGGNRIVTGATLAALLSARYHQAISPALVRVWAQRGYILRVGADEAGRPTYDMDTVIAFADTRRQRKNPVAGGCSPAGARLAPFGEHHEGPP